MKMILEIISNHSET